MEKTSEAQFEEECCGLGDDDQNQRWSLDFMLDAHEDGRRYRVLNVIDDFSQE
ncbi:hypothetical protein SAMN05443635_115102, partial [Roseobacter denitrificans OCh 114]